MCLILGVVFVLFWDIISIRLQIVSWSKFLSWNTIVLSRNWMISLCNNPVWFFLQMYRLLCSNFLYYLFEVECVHNSWRNQSDLRFFSFLSLFLIFSTVSRLGSVLLAPVEMSPNFLPRCNPACKPNIVWSVYDCHCIEYSSGYPVGGWNYF